MMTLSRLKTQYFSTSQTATQNLQRNQLGILYTYHQHRCNHIPPHGAPKMMNGGRAALLICIRHAYKSLISAGDSQIKAMKLSTKRSQYSAYLFDFLFVGTCSSVLGHRSDVLLFIHVTVKD